LDYSGLVSSVISSVWRLISIEVVLGVWGVVGVGALESRGLVSSIELHRCLVSSIEYRGLVSNKE
jgi:hypothetical protein